MEEMAFIEEARIVSKVNFIFNFLESKNIQFNLFELRLLLYFLCQRIILKGYRLAKRDLMFATLKCISSHLVWLKKINQIQIIVLKLIPRLVSFLSTNILSPSLLQFNLNQRFFLDLSCFLCFIHLLLQGNFRSSIVTNLSRFWLLR